MRARLDGRVTDYFEWRAAGHVETVYGAMHAAARLARDLFFGTDGRSLFVRVDPFEPGSLDGTRVVLRTPWRPGDALEAPSGSTRGDVATALDRVLEIQAPLEALAEPGQPVRFAVEIRSGHGVSQRIPADGFAELPAPEADPSRYDWSV